MTKIALFLDIRTCLMLNVNRLFGCLCQRKIGAYLWPRKLTNWSLVGMAISLMRRLACTVVVVIILMYYQAGFIKIQLSVTGVSVSLFCTIILLL